MGDIQHQRRPPRHYLKTARQFDFEQATADVLHGHGQSILQYVERGQHAGGVGQLAVAAQGGPGEAAAVAAAPRVLPLAFLPDAAEVAAVDLHVGADGLRMIQQTLRRVGIAADAGLPAWKMPAFEAVSSRVLEVIHVGRVDAETMAQSAS
jgi:hypothetical protein